MNVLVIHSRDLDKPSTRFRIVNYESFLEDNGVHLTYVNRKRIDRQLLASIGDYDLVINQKCLMSMRQARAIVARSRRVIFDYDDAIYTRPRKPYGSLVGARVRRRIGFWLSNADEVTAANEFLGDYARRYRSDVTVLKMGIDTQMWRPAQPRRADGPVVIGWAGAPGNLKNVAAIERALGTVLEARPAARIAIFSGARPDLSIPFDYVPFEPGGEAAFCQTLDVGLLPLHDDEFSKGKSPIKAIQYLASGVPAVGNVFGATAEILKPDNSIAVTSEQDWVAALTRLIDDPALRGRLGAAGRAHVCAEHAMTHTRQKLLDIIRSGAA